MNAVNLFELNRRLRSIPNHNNNGNVSRRENTILIRETPHINQESKETKSLTDNLNELIEKNARLKSPNINDENHPQISYKKPINNNNINNNINYNKTPIINTNSNINIGTPSPEKKNLNFSNLNNTNNNSNNYNSNNIVSKQNLAENNAQQPISPTNKNNINVNSNLSFMKNVNNVTNQAQGEIINKGIDCISLWIDKNIPLSLIEFGKFLIKYIEKEENYKVLYEKEIKKIKEKIKKIFEKSNQSDHCLLDYLLELWDKLEVSFSNRYKTLMDFCKR